MHRHSRVIGSLIVIFGVMMGVFVTKMAQVKDANALEYQTQADVSFTFAPTLSIGLSTNSLTIDNLVPGTTNDSNTVSVTVSSNTPYGYVLSAGVGSTVSTDPYYNTSDLVHDNTTTEVPITNKFSSIATSANLESLDTDNTWGYSTSTDNGTNWSAYSGLSHTATKPLLDISAAAQPSTIDFKIAARSATTQASGTYNNVITFYAVGKPAPLYMQDTEAIKLQLKNTGDELQAIDQRDGKEYWIGKMADGKIWMTQNLDLDLNSQTALTPENTNISANWTPANSTISFTGTSVSGWQNDYNVPYSADPGDVYYYSSGTTNNDEQYISLADCQAAHPDCSAKNHAGNYYNWPAAVASNSTSSMTTRYDNAPDSICPAGWRLPIARDSANTAASREWNTLLVAEGIMTNPTGSGYATDGFNNIRISPLWLARSGYVSNRSLNSTGNYGYYWSSTVYDSNNAYQLYFSAGSVTPASNYGRSGGCSIRCVAE